MDRDVLAGRVRALLADEPTTREVRMFGGLAFLVDDRMVVSALRGGAMLVRVSAERHDELVARPGAAQAEMGAGRTMGPGWIEVAADALASEDGLRSWLAVAMEHHAASGG